MKSPSNNMSQLPEPRVARGGLLPGILAILALCAVGSAADWLSLDDGQRAGMRQRLVTLLDDMTAGTPLAGISELLDAEPPVPPSVTSPPTAPGTLSGRSVQGSVGAPVDTSMLPGGAAQTVDTAAAPAQDVAPRVVEDSRVRLSFVDDLAAYLVGRYQPGARGGSLALSPQALNQRYGARLIGLDGGAQGGRTGVLDYVFHPAMIRGLYQLYVERFLLAVSEEAERPHNGRTLSPAQVRQLYSSLAGYVVTLAGALDAVQGMPELRQRLDALDDLARQTVDASAQVSTAVFDLDALREQKAGAAELATAQLRVDSLSAQYRGLVARQTAARAALVSDIRRRGVQGMDEETVLYLARWIDRRLRQDADAGRAVQTAVGVVRDLGSRFARGASGGALVPPRPQQPSPPPASGAAQPSSPLPPAAAQPAPAPAVPQLPAEATGPAPAAVPPVSAVPAVPAAPPAPRVPEAAPAAPAAPVPVPPMAR